MDEALFKEAHRVVRLAQLTHQNVCYVFDRLQFW